MVNDQGINLLEKLEEENELVKNRLWINLQKLLNYIKIEV